MFEFQRLHWVASITGVLGDQAKCTYRHHFAYCGIRKITYLAWFIGLGLISAFGLVL